MLFSAPPIISQSVLKLIIKGPEALSSVLTGITVHKELLITGGDPNQIASAVCFVVGLLAITLTICRLGFISDVISGFILCGFVLGGHLY